MNHPCNSDQQRVDTQEGGRIEDQKGKERQNLYEGKDVGGRREAGHTIC